MTRGLSLYLDLLRFLAAVAVFFTHAAQDHLSALWLGGLNRFGHDAVVVFFVLSGFVIQHTVVTRNRSFGDYAISRLARLWSVVLPALLLTVVLDLAGRAIDPAAYAAIDPSASSFLAGVLFLNQLWFLDIDPIGNNPFWSLGFEFWYYAWFAAIIFLTGWARCVVVCMTMLVMGPKILLLLPVWLMGVGVYRLRSVQNPGLAWLLFATPMFLYPIYRLADVSGPLSIAVTSALPLPNLGMAKYFASDYLVGLLVAANFLGAKSLAWPRIADWIDRPVRFLSGFTFSIYLFHYPIMLFLATLLPRGSYVALPLSFSAIILLGFVSEARKDDWRTALQGIVKAWKSERNGQSFQERGL